MRGRPALRCQPRLGAEPIQPIRHDAESCSREPHHRTPDEAGERQPPGAVDQAQRRGERTIGTHMAQRLDDGRLDDRRLLAARRAIEQRYQRRGVSGAQAAGMPSIDRRQAVQPLCLMLLSQALVDPGARGQARRGRFHLAAAGLALVASVACGRPDPAEWTLDIRPLALPAGANSSEPQFTTSDRGVLLSWIEQAGSTSVLKFAERTSSGWTQPVTVASGEDWFLSYADMPSVLRLSNGTLVAQWLEKTDELMEAYDLHLSYSTDEGKTWAPSFVPRAAESVLHWRLRPGTGCFSRRSIKFPITQAVESIDGQLPGYRRRGLHRIARGHETGA